MLPWLLIIMEQSTPHTALCASNPTGKHTCWGELWVSWVPSPRRPSRQRPNNPAVLRGLWHKSPTQTRPRSQNNKGSFLIPLSPLPHANTSLSLVTATTWEAPQATWTSSYPRRASTILGYERKQKEHRGVSVPSVRELHVGNPLAP